MNRIGNFAKFNPACLDIILATKDGKNYATTIFKIPHLFEWFL